MRNTIILSLAVLAGVIWVFYPPKGVPENQVTRKQADSIALPEFSAAAQTGQTYYLAKCAECHGQNGVGSDKGPPLIHRIYEPSHHGDEAFQRAAKLGVQSHHWGFGDMLPVQGITRAEVQNIVAYIRELQRANGIN